MEGDVDKSYARDRMRAGRMKQQMLIVIMDKGIQDE